MSNQSIKKEDFVRLFIIPFFLLLLWLNLFEHSPRDKYTSTFTKVAFYVVSFILPIFIYYFFKVFGKFPRKLLLIALSTTLFIATMDMICYGISKDSMVFYNETHHIKKLLFKNDTITIYGRKRGFLKRYRKVGYGGRSRGEEPLLSEIPTDFKEYAFLIDKGYKKLNWPDVKSNLFLTMQYPDYVFRVSNNKLVSSREYVQRVNGVEKVNPIFTDIIFGTFFTERIPSYFNCFFFLIKSPNYRTDLIDDPYFLIWRGEIEKAKERLHKLPRKRREFIENKLRAMGY